MPVFGEFSRSSQDVRESDYDSIKSWDDRPNSLKSGMRIFLVFLAEVFPNSKTLNGLKIARIAPILTIFGQI